MPFAHITYHLSCKLLSLIFYFLLEPEFTVTRRDSLCMAAKEHTLKMLGDDSVNKNQDSEVDTINIRSTAVEANNENFFSAGTFAVIDKIETMEDSAKNNLMASTRNARPARLTIDN